MDSCALLVVQGVSLWRTVASLLVTCGGVLLLRGVVSCRAVSYRVPCLFYECSHLFVFLFCNVRLCSTVLGRVLHSSVRVHVLVTLSVRTMFV